MSLGTHPLGASPFTHKNNCLHACCFPHAIPYSYLTPMHAPISPPPLVWQEPWEKRHDFSSELASKIAECCPALLHLNIRRLYLDSLRTLEPLAQLQRLESLHLMLPPRPFEERDLAEPEVIALGSLTGLEELHINYRYHILLSGRDSDGAKKLNALLPVVARLQNLRRLHLTDRKEWIGLPGPGPLDLGAVSCLLSLPHLTSLAWTSPGYGLSSSLWCAGSVAFEATCALSQLVQLDLASYVITDDSHIALLASMPSLKRLLVKSLVPSKPVIVSRCAWEYVWFHSASHTDLARLPLAEVQRIDFTPKDGGLSCVCFEVGQNDSPDAGELNAAAKALARACIDDLVVRLTWKDEEDGYAYFDASSCLLGALAPLGGILVRLSLDKFAVDASTLAELSSAFPRMQSLALHESAIHY